MTDPYFLDYMFYRKDRGLYVSCISGKEVIITVSEKYCMLNTAIA